jgi:thiamine-phosphate pyrophosphorylase
LGRERPQLHLVTDPRYGPAALLAGVRAAAEKGVDWVQVRDHQATADELYRLASEIVGICRTLGVRVAVNDRVDVALAVGADGVQLGRQSLPIAEVRRIAPGLLIGASVHSLDEAREADAAAADWLTFGHVFPTASHPDVPARGVEALAEVVAAVPQPVIAIGGIGPAQVAPVLAAGAAGVAVISAILGAVDPAAATLSLYREIARRP